MMFVNKWVMIVVVFGLPGTGKSFFSKRFAFTMDAVHINTDIVREDMHKKGQYDESSRMQVYIKMVEKMAKHISNGSNCVLDGTFQRRNHRRLVIDKAKQLKQDLYFIYLTAEDETIRIRLKQSRQHTEADYDVYKKIKNNYEIPLVHHLQLQTDKLEINQMIHKAKQYIYDKR